MKTWEIGAKIGIGGLRMVERTDPVPGAGEVLIRVAAAGLNYRDLMVCKGQYGNALPDTRVPLSDGVGVIEALGEGVRGWSQGQRVIAPHFVAWLDGRFSMAAFGQDLGVTADGWLAEKTVVPASALIAVPDAVRDETAAAFAVAGGTVWHAMCAFGEAEPGKLVLAQGTGGVSIFALQLAKAIGADFAITSSSDEKLARCRAMGADYTVNYRKSPDWATALLEATGGRGADLVIDTLGFPALGETINACAVEARIGTLGALSGTPQAHPSASQGVIIAKNITIKGIASGSRAMLAKALDVFATSGIDMLVDKAFAFDQVHDAYAHLESGAHMGKVMIKVTGT